LLHASFRPHLAAVALAFSLALHLHQVGQRTFTSKLLSMPSTRLNRYAVNGDTTVTVVSLHSTPSAKRGRILAR
jgi:hypothetical protein